MIKRNDSPTQTCTGTNGLLMMSSNTVQMNDYAQPEIVQTKVFEDRIEITYKSEPLFTYTSTHGLPTSNSPKVWKEVFRAEGSKLVKTKVDGLFSAGHYVEDSYNFPEE